MRWEFMVISYSRSRIKNQRVGPRKMALRAPKTSRGIWTRIDLIIKRKPCQANVRIQSITDVSRPNVRFRPIADIISTDLVSGTASITVPPIECRSCGEWEDR